jgi:hypothetical protein
MLIVTFIIASLMLVQDSRAQCLQTDVDRVYPAIVKGSASISYTAAPSTVIPLLSAFPVVSSPKNHVVVAAAFSGKGRVLACSHEEVLTNKLNVGGILVNSAFWASGWLGWFDLIGVAYLSGGKDLTGGCLPSKVHAADVMLPTSGSCHTVCCAVGIHLTHTAACCCIRQSGLAGRSSITP